MEQKTFDKRAEEREKELAEERLAAEVTADFERRREERRGIENGWRLNMNFFSGNQYCDVSPFGGLVEEDKQYYWQSRRAFNHIAPAVDSRVAKLEKLKPVLKVRAFSDEDGDLKAAQLATGILQYVQERIGLQESLSKATAWAEVCGSVFYKVLWNEEGGRQVAVDEENRPIYEGEVQVSVVPPFEIFPDRLDAEDFDEVQSVIQAQAVSASYVFEKFGVAVEGTEMQDLFGYSEASSAKLPADVMSAPTAKLKDGVLLLERYTKPSAEVPDGRLEIVAGGKLVYAGPLPYKNGERGERTFPFIKQDSLRLPGSFFATSIVDRLIPVQRAYNAVRNRKHEFLNRLSMGVLTVEDGSVDTDELAEEGLLPGTVLVYRQGGKAPEMLDCGNVPSEFKEEEAWLEKEFSVIGGISEVAQSSTAVRVTSATGLQLLISQDESRLAATVACIQKAMKGVGRQILRLYRQFAGSARLMTLTGENKKTQVYYFNASKLDVNDIHFEAQDSMTAEEKKAILLKLYEAGLLTDKDGKLTQENKQRILDAFGFGSYENARDISSLHIAKAGEENILMKTGDAEVDSYDDHALHITEHIRFLLSSEFKKIHDGGVTKKRFEAHIAEHEKSKK